MQLFSVVTLAAKVFQFDRISDYKIRKVYAYVVLSRECGEYVETYGAWKNIIWIRKWLKCINFSSYYFGSSRKPYNFPENLQRRCPRIILARLSCILQSFSSKSDRQDTIFAIPFDLVTRVSLLSGKKGDPGNEVAVLCFNKQLALRGHVVSFVTWFCLQNTISGSSLKHSKSDLVFQTRTICLKWESS